MLTDDAAARLAARQRGLEVTGIIGVLVEARRQGLISEVAPLLVELRRLGQWLSDELIETVRREEGSEA